jgi:hypothetical protein
VPAWVAIVIALITGGAAVAAAVLSARAARTRLKSELEARTAEQRSERAARSNDLQMQLRHEWAMRVRDENRTALDEAAVIGVRFRERLATALREVDGSEKVPRGAVTPLALDRDDLIELRGAEARLILRFGAEHETTTSFEAFHESVKAGVKVVQVASRGGTDCAETRACRQAARAALAAYFAAAERTLKLDPTAEPSDVHVHGAASA